MAKPVNWTLSARNSRQKILESLVGENDNMDKCHKFVMLIRIHIKYISKYNFAGIEANYTGMRETTCGDYKLIYKIRSQSISIMGIFRVK